MSVARFIADQRTMYRVPHAVCCRILGVSQAWLYKWLDRSGRAAGEVASQVLVPAAEPPPVGPSTGPSTGPVAEREGAPVAGPGSVPVAGPVVPGGVRGFTSAQRRRRWLDAQVAASFKASSGTYGSPRVFDDLAAVGWAVSVNTVAASMRRQRLVARPVKRYRGLTRQDKAAVPFPDLLKRDFTAPAPNRRWVGDVTEIPTAEGKLYQATVIDLYSRRLLAAVTSVHPDADLCTAAIKAAVAVRGGKDAVAGVVFHSDRGSTYTDYGFSKVCRELGITQSMGRVGSCFDCESVSRLRTA